MMETNQSEPNSQESRGSFWKRLRITIFVLAVLVAVFVFVPLMHVARFYIPPSGFVVPLSPTPTYLIGDDHFIDPLRLEKSVYLAIQNSIGQIDPTSTLPFSTWKNTDESGTPYAVSGGEFATASAPLFEPFLSDCRTAGIPVNLEDSFSFRVRYWYDRRDKDVPPGTLYLALEIKKKEDSGFKIIRDQKMLGMLAARILHRLEAQVIP